MAYFYINHMQLNELPDVGLSFGLQGQSWTPGSFSKLEKRTPTK